MAFIFQYGGWLGALLFMIPAAKVSSRAPRIALSVIAVGLLLAHAVCCMALVGIGSSGSVGDAALAGVRNRLILGIGLIVAWMLVLEAESKTNSWHPMDAGKTLGTPGSESGKIVLDEEHGRGARITLEATAQSSPWAITCGIYGLMVHTAFASSEEEARNKYRAMKSDLESILQEGNPQTTKPKIDAFVAKY